MKMMTTQEWQESISIGIKSLTENMEKIAEAFLSSQPVVKENLTTEKPLPKQVVEDVFDNAKFEKGMWLYSFFELFLFTMFAIITFYKIQMLFGFWFGFAGASTIALVLQLRDKYTMKGDSLGKVSKDANAVTRYWATLAFVFVVCFAIGNTLISDPARGEEYKQPNIERQYKNIDSIAPEINSEGYGNSGSSER
jgi:hypothetical protein